MSSSREKFEANVLDLVSQKKNIKCQTISPSEYLDRIGIIERTDPEERNRHYWHLIKHYEVRVIEEKEYLFSKAKGLQLVHTGELFDCINTAHLQTGHGCRDTLRKHLSRLYANIGIEAIMTYLKYCSSCELKRSKSKTKLVVKPILSSAMNSRGQVDLLDMQTAPDRDYKFILNYQDHFTKFCILRPLRSKSMHEVADNLIDIFTLIGAPNILQSDNGKEFANHLVSEIADMWKGCKIVHGKPRHSQSQWADGLRFVQSQKNTCTHSGIGRTPYRAMFGQDPRWGLASCKIPSAMVDGINTEDELENVLRQIDGQREEEITQAPMEEANRSQNMDLDHGQDDSTLDSVINDGEMDLAAMLTISDDTAQEDIDVPDQNVGLKKQTLTNRKRPTNKSQGACCSPSCKILTDTSHTCKECKDFCHVPCGQETEEGGEILCPFCSLLNERSVERLASKRKMEDQASRMLEGTKKKLNMAEVGCTVRVRIPEVDRGRLDPKNILACVMSHEGDSMYRLGTQNGILKKLYTRADFDISIEKFMEVDQIPKTEIGFREAVGKASVSGNTQGFVKCDCNKKCQTKICKCRKKGILCNSKCHNSSSCCNK